MKKTVQTVKHTCWLRILFFKKFLSFNFQNFFDHEKILATVESLQRRDASLLVKEIFLQQWNRGGFFMILHGHLDCKENAIISNNACTIRSGQCAMLYYC